MSLQYNYNRLHIVALFLSTLQVKSLVASTTFFSLLALSDFTAFCLLHLCQKDILIYRDLIR